MDDASRENAMGGMMSTIPWSEYLGFRRMVTPVIIKAVFWLAVLVNTIFALIGMVVAMSASNGAALFGGLAILIFGPLVIRIYCELLLVIFSINDTLIDIKNQRK